MKATDSIYAANLMQKLAAQYRVYSSGGSPTVSRNAAARAAYGTPNLRTPGSDYATPVTVTPYDVQRAQREFDNFVQTGRSPIAQGWQGSDPARLHYDRLREQYAQQQAQQVAQRVTEDAQMFPGSALDKKPTFTTTGPASTYGAAPGRFNVTYAPGAMPPQAQPAPAAAPAPAPQATPRPQAAPIPQAAPVLPPQAPAPAPVPPAPQAAPQPLPATPAPPSAPAPQPLPGMTNLQKPVNSVLGLDSLSFNSAPGPTPQPAATPSPSPAAPSAPFDRSGSGARIAKIPFDRSGSGARIAGAQRPMVPGVSAVPAPPKVTQQQAPDPFKGRVGV